MRNLKRITEGKASADNTDYLETYFNLMTLNGSVRVFNAAYQSGILKSFKNGPQTANTVSAELRYDEKTVKLILDALVSLRLFDKKSDLYIPSPAFALLKGDYENLSSDYWDHLPELIRTGEPMKRMDDKLESESEYKKQVSSLDWMMSPSAFELVDLLDIGNSRKNLNILDVGAGSGVWSIPILMKDRSSKATLLDWDGVLETARTKAKDRKIVSQIAYLPGDFFSVEIPEKYDLIILGNVLHTLNEEKSLELLGRLKDCLSKNGELVVIDVFPENDEFKLSSILYEIGLRLRTESGQVYKLHELKELLVKAGYTTQGSLYMSNVPPHIMGACIAKQ